MADEPTVKRTPSKVDTLSQKLGIEFTYSADGACLATLDAGPQVCNINGVVHGAVLFTMADTGMGFALLAALGDEPLLSSITVTATYLRPAMRGRIEARASVVHLGRSVAFVTCTARDGEGSACAQFSGIYRVRTERGEQQP